jgi:hypothetical protein
MKEQAVNRVEGSGFGMEILSKNDAIPLVEYK